jgi:hypothetical protein
VVDGAAVAASSIVSGQGFLPGRWRNLQGVGSGLGALVITILKDMRGLHATSAARYAAPKFKPCLRCRRQPDYVTRGH